MTFATLTRAAAAGMLILALAACGGGDEGAATGPEASGATTDKIQVEDFAFKPESTTVKAGTTVTWTFGDAVDHNVEGVGAGAELKKSPDLKSGGTYPFTFTKAGTYDYRCTIHNSMTGKVVVTG